MHKLSLALILAAAGCATDAIDAAEKVVIVPPDVEAEFYDTIIDVADDGSTIVRYEPLSPEQLRSENHLRETGATPRAVRDTNCLSSSLWLYDQANASGSRICFRWSVGFAYLDLQQFPRRWAYYDGVATPLSYWDLSTGSYWPGQDSGAFLFVPSAQSFGVSFSAYQGVTNLNVSPATARYLQM